MKFKMIMLCMAVLFVYAIQALGDGLSDIDAKKIVKSYLNNKEPKGEGDQVTNQLNKWILNDIDGDGEKDVIIQYTLLGPTWWKNYLAAILIKKGKPQKPIETEISGEVALNNIDNGVIIISGKKYAKGDPICCPSIGYVAKYKLKDKKIIEVNK